MQSRKRLAGVLVLCGWLTAGVAAAQTSRPSPASRPTVRPIPRPASRPALPPATAPDPDSVAVIINGHPVKESVVNEVLSRGQPVTQSQAAERRQMYRNSMWQVMDAVIGNELVEQEARKAGLSVSDKEALAQMEEGLDNYLKSSGTSREEYTKQVEERFKKSLADFLAERANNPLYRRGMLQTKLVRHKFADEVKVSDQEIKDFYEKNLERRFKQPEQVRASHILFKTNELKGDDAAKEKAKAELKKKAEEVLKEVKKPGADFATLAKEHSGCPSGKRAGGDLDFFTRERMVAPFSAAAFKMKIGDISDIVETDFGYHIIKVTDRKEAKTRMLDEVKDAIRTELEEQKAQNQLRVYKEDLRKSAKIEYPPGKQPVSRPAPATRPMMRPPTSRPTTGMGGAAVRPGTQPSGGRQIRVVPNTPK